MRLFRFVSVLLLFVAVFLNLPAKSRLDRFKEVLEKTAADLNFKESVRTSGSETADALEFNLDHPLVAGKSFLQKGVTLNVTWYRSRKVKQAFQSVYKGMGKLVTDVLVDDSPPPPKRYTKIIQGHQVEVWDIAPYTYKTPGISGTTPRRWAMMANAGPLISVSVTTTGGPDPAPYMVQLLKNLEEAGLLASTDQGVSFRVLAEKEGWVSDSRVVDTGNTSPSSISVTGQVVDDRNNPVAGARVSIPSLKESGITDLDGHFHLSVETTGKKPFSTSMTLTLKPPATGLQFTFENPDPLPVPGTAEIKIHVKDETGKPVKAGKVKLHWTVPDFVTAAIDSGQLNREGVLRVPIQLGAPPDPGKMIPEPASLWVKLGVTVTPEDGGKPGAATLDIPLNLALITGTTVGPDMKARPERNAPGLLRANPALFVARWKDDSGKFRVLVHPFHPVSHKTPGVWWLAWSDADRLPLEFPLQENPQPGTVIDVGKVDVLTPDEHVRRLREVASEFFAAMPLTPSEQSGIQKALQRIVFSDGGVGNVPYFTDNFTNDTGVIHMPGSSKDYWKGNLHVEEDPAYEIIPHELGHFTHHHLVERFSYINMCYNKLSTGVHFTWSTEPGQLPVKLPFISFSENTADFFALLFRKFWIERHPEIKDSVYFKRPGYLHEFETDEKAMAVVSSMEPGYMVEGVQTRFLRVFYGNASQNRPAAVFSDYLNTMLLYMDRPQGWLEGLVNRPARTIYQWVETKRRMPGAFGPADPVALATRYRLIPGAPPAPTATMAYGEKTAHLQINGKNVDFNSFPVVPVPFGSNLKAIEGTISIDLSDMDTRRTITLKAPAEIVLESRTEITVNSGLVGVDFPATLNTPGGKVTPLGTVVQVRVDENGNTEVDTLEGNVRVSSAGGSVRMLKAGQSLSMDASGTLSKISGCNPVEIVSNLLPKVTLPPVPATGSLGKTTIENWKQRLSSFPWWAIAGAVLFSFLIFATLLWLLRRLLAALLLSPLVAAGFLVIGRLVLQSTGNASFGKLLVSPWTAWTLNADWLPAAAWLTGGLIAGFILRGWFRGFVAGLLVVLAPWILFHAPFATAAPGNRQGLLALGKQMAQNPGPDLLALFLVSGLGGFIGGLLLPRKSRPHQPGRKRTPPSRRRYYDDPGPDFYPGEHHGGGDDIPDDNIPDNDPGDFDMDD